MDFVILGFRPMCFLKLLSLSGSSNFLQSIIHTERPSHTPRVVVLETVNKLVVVFPRAEFFMSSQEFMTTMRRPGRLLKIRKSTAHDNRVSLKHTPQKFTTAFIDHRMCDTIGKIRAVNTRFIVTVDEKIIQQRITDIIVVFQMINPDHEQTCLHLSCNFQ